jgi:hypothetical protein
MATTTEPPWVHVGSGVAARNGTTSHTINFGFTSTSGNLLVVIVFAGVTNAASGWVEQLQPVSSGELSVFTKTSAGDTSITITHNAANYPENWIAYEFPAGSSYDAGQSDTTSADTPPSITGLPGGAGNERLVITARGRIAGSASETSASTVWGGSMVEDLDLFTAFATTDGCYLTVAHQINVTTTSLAPTGTPTYGGTWGVGDREKATFSIIAAPVAGTTPVSGTLDLRWNSYTAVTGSVDLRWNSRTTVVGTLDLRWNSRTSVAGSLDLRWNSLTAVSGTLSLPWNSRTLVSSTLDLRWNSYTAVAGSIDLRWNSRTLVSGSLDLRWNSYTTVGGTLDLRWDSASGGSSTVSGTLDLRWNSYTAVSSSIALVWNSRTLVAGTLDLRWNVRSQISGSLDLRWISRALATGTLVLLWKSDGVNLRLPADVVAYLDERFTVDLRDSIPSHLTGL